MAEETPKNLEEELEKAMAINTNLKKANAALRRKVKKLEALLAPVPDEVEAILSRPCINCGATGRTSYDKNAKPDEDKIVRPFECSACGHRWSAADEEAPFRARLKK